MDAETLVRRLQEHDSKALEIIMQRYTAYVIAVIRRVGVPPLSEEDVEELASDTFEALWRTADRIREPSSLKAYLGQIARNLSMGRRRRHKNDLPLEEDVLTAAEDTTQTLAALHEQTAILCEALAAMEPLRRSCLIRRYYYGDSLAEIAKALCVPLSTVKSHVYRGRKQLIESLDKGGYTYEDRGPSGLV